MTSESRDACNCCGGELPAGQERGVCGRCGRAGCGPLATGDGDWTRGHLCPTNDTKTRLLVVGDRVKKSAAATAANVMRPRKNLREWIGVVTSVSKDGAMVYVRVDGNDSASAWAAKFWEPI